MPIRHSRCSDLTASRRLASRSRWHKAATTSSSARPWRTRWRRLPRKLPVGIEPHLVADQSVVVEEAVGGFTKALWEAIAIVLGVSFLSLGLRAGVVVACSIPLVLGMVFVYMEYSGISLQRISLGALIIALGLLVDDAMITIEMMVSQLELGVDREHAATHAWTTTAFPMLTGTLVTVAGFVPIGFAKSGAGEYCYSLFAVIAVALLASWIVAVVFAPVIGVTILPKTMKPHADGHAEPGRFMRLFRAALIFCMRARWLVIAVTVGLFAASLYGYGFIQQQFFPASDRPELIVDLNLPQDASIYATEHEVGAVRGTAERRPQHRSLQLLCRSGCRPFLSAAECSAGQRLLRRGGYRHQRDQGA